MRHGEQTGVATRDELAQHYAPVIPPYLDRYDDRHEGRLWLSALEDDDRNQPERRACNGA